MSLQKENSEFNVFLYEIDRIIIKIGKYSKKIADELKIMSENNVIKFLQRKNLSDAERQLLPSNVWLFSNHNSEMVCKWIVDNLPLDDKEDLQFYLDENIYNEKWKVEYAKQWLLK